MGRRGVPSPPPLFVWGREEAFRTRAFSLRRGDHVQVTGELKLPSPYSPSINAQELTVVNAAIAQLAGTSPDVVGQVLYMARRERAARRR